MCAGFIPEFIQRSGFILGLFGVCLGVGTEGVDELEADEALGGDFLEPRHCKVALCPAFPARS